MGKRLTHEERIPILVNFTKEEHKRVQNMIMACYMSAGEYCNALLLSGLPLEDTDQKYSCGRTDAVRKSGIMCNLSVHAVEIAEKNAEAMGVSKTAYLRHVMLNSRLASHRRPNFLIDSGRAYFPEEKTPEKRLILLRVTDYQYHLVACMAWRAGMPIAYYCRMCVNNMDIYAIQRRWDDTPMVTDNYWIMDAHDEEGYLRRKSIDRDSPQLAIPLPDEEIERIDNAAIKMGVSRVSYMRAIILMTRVRATPGVITLCASDENPDE